MSTQVSILGNTGRDPELRYTPTGLAVANFSVASNTVRNTPDGQIKKTDWFNVAAFGKQAETLSKYLKKGSSILVRGRLTFNAWTSDSGEPRVSADVILQDFDFAGSGNGNARERSEQNGTPASGDAGTDAPFPTKELQAAADEPDGEEKAEMMGAVQELDHTDEIYAGQY